MSHPMLELNAEVLLQRVSDRIPVVLRGLLGIRDYAELLVALGNADLPMPLPPAHDVENQALAFARIWKQA